MEYKNRISFFIRRFFILCAIGLVRIYQVCLSPLFPPSCRFAPTCSAYSIEAFKKFGFIRGTYLTVKRVIRCNPWNPGGYDPVPEQFQL